MYAGEVLSCEANVRVVDAGSLGADIYTVALDRRARTRQRDDFTGRGSDLNSAGG